MAQHENESATWGIAARAIRDRIRALPEFAEARAIVRAAAIAECRGRDVAGMRELGGFSAVIERHVRALPDRFRAPLGSQLLPSDVATELLTDIPQLRAEVQCALAPTERELDRRDGCYR